MPFCLQACFLIYHKIVKSAICRSFLKENCYEYVIRILHDLCNINNLGVRLDLLFLAKEQPALHDIVGVCWIVYSVMFSLDFIYLSDFYNSVHYIAERQALSIIAALLFLAGTHRFFRLQLARDFYSVTLLCLFIILIATFSEELYDLIIIPAIMFSTGLLVWAGWIFISYSWTQIFRRNSSRVS